MKFNKFLQILTKFGAVILVLVVFFETIPISNAASTSLYLSPSKGSFTVGSTFTVSIYLNSEGNEINVVEADLNFSPDKIQVTAPTTGSSFVSEWLTPPSYSNTQGTISFRGGILGGINTSSGWFLLLLLEQFLPEQPRLNFQKPQRCF